MKSLASGETWENASSANSQSQRATFWRVSRSSSPAKGDSPLNLYNKALKLHTTPWFNGHLNATDDKAYFLHINWSINKSRNSQNVSQDNDSPHVCVEMIGSESTISGAANSAVAVVTLTISSGFSLVARPKSIILTFVDFLVSHITFSGYNMKFIDKKFKKFNRSQLNGQSH